MSSFFSIADSNPARRQFLGRSGLVLSGAALALLSGRDALAAKSGGARAGDVRILNSALGSELEAIAAYQVGAESGLLQKPALDLALQFQGHHKAHAALLAATVQKLGGKPIPAKDKYGFPVDQLKSQADVLRFAHDLRVPATSNQAERDLRPSKTQQKISGRLTCEKRTQDRYTILGYVSTAAKHGIDKITALRDALTGQPWMPAALPTPA